MDVGRHEEKNGRTTNLLTKVLRAYTSKAKKPTQGHRASKQQRQDLSLDCLTENLTLFQHFSLVLLADLCSPDVTA